MLNQLFFILVLSIVSSGSYATIVDNCTLPECLNLKVRLDLRIQKLQSEIAPALGSVVKKDSASEKYCSRKSKTGGICFMTQQKAIDYCASQQNHLPSTREMALLSIRLGAKGIVDACGNDDDCNRIKVENLDKTIDEFYFSNSGYRPPEGELGKIWIWSSSISVYSRAGSVFDGTNGRIDYLEDSSGDYSDYYSEAVRCAVGR